MNRVKIACPTIEKYITVGVACGIWENHLSIEGDPESKTYVCAQTENIARLEGVFTQNRIATLQQLGCTVTTE